jgi:predicted enzyme related to lactoylglutathione lyase
MPNNLAAFSIHVDDVNRARTFYEAVFEWVFEPWGPPGRRTCRGKRRESDHAEISHSDGWGIGAFPRYRRE